MARKNQVLTWHVTLCLDCDPPALTYLADNRAGESWIRHHRTGHASHEPIEFSHAGYGGEQFASRDAVTKLLNALASGGRLTPKADP